MVLGWLSSVKSLMWVTDKEIGNGEWDWLTESRIKFNTKRLAEQYWIDRRGKVYKYDGDLSEEIVSFHSEIAAQIYPDSERPDDVLLRLGWVKVGATGYECSLIDKKPTQAQLDKLDRLGLLQSLLFLYEKRYLSYNEYSILCD